MKKYLLGELGDKLCLYQLDEETNANLNCMTLTRETFFNILSEMIESLQKIEKMTLCDNLLKMTVIRFNDNYQYEEEERIYEIDNNLINDKDFSSQLYHYLNRYRAELRQETIDNIAKRKFCPQAIRKKTL